MEVERLTARLDADGLAGFQASMAAADKATGVVNADLEKLTAVSQIAGGALERVRMTVGQAAETSSAAATMNRSVSSVTATAVAAADELERVKMGPGQAAETSAAAAAITGDLKAIEDQAADTRRSLEGLGAVEAAGGAAGGGGGLGGLLAAAGWGGGHRFPIPFTRYGFPKGAGFGSLLGLAGFGAERAITSSLGIGGSVLGGLFAGGGLLGLGALGTSAVGMGTDLAGIGQAAGDIKQVSGALGNLKTAIATYGRDSAQARTAQAQLNTTLASFSPVARSAVLAAAQTASGFKDMFDKATGAAEKTGAEIINQAMHTGEAFLPTIGKYAAQNMGIIQTRLQPLFAWLKNPAFSGPGRGGGLGIFTNLEQIFQRNLPSGVHAMSQGLELLVKTVDVAAQHLGGFTRSIDQLLTRLNGPGFSGWATSVNHMIGLFDDLMHLVGATGGLLVDLFRPAVGFGQAFIVGLTQIINLTRQWLNASGTQDVLHNLFAAHLAQMEAFFALFRALLPALEATASAFLQIEGAVSSLLAGPLKALADIVGHLTSDPLAAKILGWVAALYLARKALGGVWTMTRLLQLGLLGLGPAAITGAAEADAAVASVGTSAEAATAEVGGLRGALMGLGSSSLLNPLTALAATLAVVGYSAYKAFTAGPGVSHVAPGQQNSVYLAGVGTFQKINGKWYRLGPRGADIPATRQQAEAADKVERQHHHAATTTAAQMRRRDREQQHHHAATTTAAQMRRRDREQQHDQRVYQHDHHRDPRPGTHAWYMKYLGYDPTQPGSYQHATGGGPGGGSQVLPRRLQDAIYNAQTQVSLAGNGPGRVAALDQLLAAEKQALKWLDAQHATGQKLLELDRERATVAREIAATQGQLAKTGGGSSNPYITSGGGFQIPLSMQLALAKADAMAAAVNGPGLTEAQRRLALEVKAAVMKAIRSHQLSMQGLIDAWNEIAQINQQLAQSQGMIDTYHAASTKALTEGLDLSKTQRDMLRERLASSQAHRGHLPSGPALLGEPVDHHRRRRHHPLDGGGGGPVDVASVGQAAGITINGDVYLGGPIRKTDQLYRSLEDEGRHRKARRGVRR